MSRTHIPAVGISLTIAAYFVMSLFSALNKYVQELGFPASEVMLFDGFVGAFCMIAIALQQREFSGLKMRNVPLQLVLMVVNVAAGFLIFQAYPHLQLVNAYLISFTGPLMITTLSSLVLKERIGAKQIVPIIIGFAGVIIALGPQEMAFNMAMLKMFGGVVLFSIAQVMVRKMSDSESTWSFPFYFYIGMFFVSLVLFHAEFVLPQAPREWALMSMLGVLDAASLAMVYLGLKFAKASTVVPFQYSAMIWVVLLDLVLWNKVPALHTYIGGTILIAAGIYLAAFSRRRRPRRRRPRQDVIG